MTLYVNESGTPNAPSILFLHGMGTSGWMWTTQISDLSNFHCLNVDLPGHGKSNHISWQSLQDTADQIAALIRSRASSGRAHVVGLSLGGYVALTLLERHPDCVISTVLSGVTSAPLPNGGMMMLQGRVMSVALKSRWFIQTQAKMLRIPDDAMEDYVNGFLAMSRPSFLRILKEMLPFQLPNALRQVNVPVLVTAGSEEMKPVIEAVNEIVRMLPNAEGRLAPGGHHGWNGEAPELFSARRRAWFGGTPLPETLHAVGGESLPTA